MQLLLSISFHFVHLDLDTFIWPSPFSWFEILHYHPLQGKSVLISLEGIHILRYLLMIVGPYTFAPIVFHLIHLLPLFCFIFHSKKLSFLMIL